MDLANERLMIRDMLSDLGAEHRIEIVVRKIQVGGWANDIDLLRIGLSDVAANVA